MSDDQQTREPKGPADTLRAGRVKATIWERDSETGPAFGTQISRTYTDKEGQPRDTPYLSGADLLRAARVAERAYDREEELKRERALTRDERRDQHRAQRSRDDGQDRSPDRGR